MDQGQKPVNPYAPAGAPYSPGSNTPVPPFASPMNPAPSSASPAVPNTSAPNNDIILPSSDPEKPKFFTKKFIILASAGLVLIVAAIITGLVLQNNRKNQSANSPSSAKSIDGLANLLVSGESADTAPELSVSEWYFERLLLSARDSNSGINNYIDTVKQSLGVLSTGDLKNDITAYLDCLAVDRYESDAAARACLSLINPVKTGVRALYNQNTEPST